MCTDVRDKNIYIMAEDTVAWKIVRRLSSGAMRSRYAPCSRASLFTWHWLNAWYDKVPWPEGRGRDLLYRTGHTTKSNWPGVYCYENQPPSRHPYSDTRVLKVIIPEGTEVVYGYDRLEQAKTICAQQVNVMSVQGLAA